MGSVTYNFLADSILFDNREIEALFSSVNDNELEKILQGYREHCLSNLETLTEEVKENKSTLKVFSR